MKWKYIKVIVIFLCVIFLYILLFKDDGVSFITFVTVTNNQLTTLKNLKYNLAKANEKALKVKHEYLVSLGFVNKTKFYPENFVRNITLPVIVTYAISGKQDEAVSFAKNVAKVLPNYLTFMYNIGLQEYELFLLQNYCKSTHCTVINFDWQIFPEYVKQDINIFRPIIIQDALNKIGAVFFVESNLRFLSSDLSSLVERAKRNGILAWSDKYPISAVTHPGMYGYFKTNATQFLFTKSVDATKIMIYKVPHIHYHVMFPWIKCVLIKNCLYPVGAQYSGCKFDKKPLFRYFGCHNSGTAALSVTLALHYNFTDDYYIYNANKSIFYNITPYDAKLELSQLVKNGTDFIYN